MEITSVKFENGFAKEMKKTMKRFNYITKAEFIREAIRDKITDLKMRRSLRRVDNLYGAGRLKYRNVADEDLHRVRDRAVKEIERELGLD